MRDFQYVLPRDLNDALEQGDVLSLRGLHETLRNGASELEATNTTRDATFTLRHRLSPRQAQMVLEGGMIPVFRAELAEERS